MGVGTYIPLYFLLPVSPLLPVFLFYFLFSSFSCCYREETRVVQTRQSKLHSWWSNLRENNPITNCEGSVACEGVVYIKVRMCTCVCVCVYVCVCRCRLGGMLGKYVSDSKISLDEQYTTVDKYFIARHFDLKVFVNCLQNDLLVCS